MTKCASGNAIQFTTKHNTVCSVVQLSHITNHACTKERHAQRPYQFQHCVHGCYTTAVRKRAMSSCAMEITVSPIQPASQKEAGHLGGGKAPARSVKLGLPSNP